MSSRQTPLRTLLMAGVLIANQACAPAGENDPPPAAADPMHEGVRAAVSAFMADQRIPGLSLAVVDGDEIVFAGGFGKADLEHGSDVDTDTVFRVASLTKAMTATAVMQLSEDGALDLDAPVRQYCPAFPQKRWPVTARSLLAHLGGIRHYRSGSGEFRNTTHFISVEEALGVFRDDPLGHEPGTRFEYSSFGYDLLGCAIEGASGRSFSQYLQERILAPSGMTRTLPDNVHRVIPNRTRGYMSMSADSAAFWPARYREFMTPGEIHHAELYDASINYAGGGMLSTAEDLARFVLAFQCGRLVSDETRQEMWTVQETTAGEATTWGLGWIIANMNGEAQIPRLSGSNAGVSSGLVLLPDKNFAVAMIANLEFIDPYPLIVTIGRLFGHFPEE